MRRGLKLNPRQAICGACVLLLIIWAISGALSSPALTPPLKSIQPTPQQPVSSVPAPVAPKATTPKPGSVKDKEQPAFAKALSKIPPKIPEPRPGFTRKPILKNLPSYSETWKTLIEDARAKNLEDSSHCQRYLTTDKNGLTAKNLPDMNNITFWALSEKDIVSWFIINRGSWEGGVLKTIVEQFQTLGSSVAYPLFNHELYFLDIGGNIGWFTTYVASCNIPTITFEPMDSNQRVLKKNLCQNGLNDRVINIQSGLGAKYSNCSLYSGVKNTGNGIVRCDNDEALPPGNEFRQELIIRTLDEYLYHPDAPKVAVVKMDVEGFEYFVAQGGFNFFKYFPPLYIHLELDLVLHEQKGVTFQMILDLVEKLNYKWALAQCKKYIPPEHFQEILPKAHDVCLVHESVFKRTF